MRILLLFALLSLSAFVFGQDTVYYNREGNFVSSIKEAEIYIVKTKIPSKDNFRNEKEYTKEGKLIEESNYSCNAKHPTLYRQGIRKRWYPNGQLKWEAFYINSKLQGKVKSFWPDGRLKREDTYKNDKLVDGKCFSSLGVDTIYYPFEVFPKNMDSLEVRKYVDRNWRYPSNYKQRNIHYHYFIDTSGRIHVRKNPNLEGDSFFEFIVVYYEEHPKYTAYLVDGDPERFDWECTIRFLRHMPY